jgi:hypothetical protein
MVEKPKTLRRPAAVLAAAAVLALSAQAAGQTDGTLGAAAANDAAHFGREAGHVDGAAARNDAAHFGTLGARMPAEPGAIESPPGGGGFGWAGAGAVSGLVLVGAGGALAVRRRGPAQA